MKEIEVLYNAVRDFNIIILVTLGLMVLTILNNFMGSPVPVGFLLAAQVVWMVLAAGYIIRIKRRLG